jgi:hypothetical protein
MYEIPLIYILSNGRSGSTLLDLLLGAHEHVWTLGEAQNLPWDLREAERVCGCGARLRECAFWRRILPRIPLDQGNYPIEFFREAQGRGKVLRWGLLPGLCRGRVPPRHREPVQEYGALNADYLATVFDAARERTGGSVRWLVDASKDPYRLFWLQHSKRFDLRVIHLTKDAPAFVYSMVKRDLPRARRAALRMTGRWLVENSIMTRLCRANFPSHQYIHVRYEDLAGRPDATCKRVGDWLGFEFPEQASREFRNRENHAVSGNQTRWQNTAIRLDRRWRSALPKNYQRFTRLLTRPLASKYGYQ